MTFLQEFPQAFKASIPVCAGYVPLGIVYGFLFTQAGAPWWLVLLFSMVVYSGAIQFALIPIFGTAGAVASAAIASFVLGIRHVFYGIPLLDVLPQRGLAKWVSAFTLTDETFSLVTGLKGTCSQRCLVVLGVINWFWWWSGSLAGALAGSQMRIDIPGLDFVLACLFGMLACEQWRSRTTSLPLWTAIAAYVLARAISAPHALAIAIFLASLAAIAFWLAKSARGQAQ